MSTLAFIKHDIELCPIHTTYVINQLQRIYNYQGEPKCRLPTL